LSVAPSLTGQPASGPSLRILRCRGGERQMSAADNCCHAEGCLGTAEKSQSRSSRQIGNRVRFQAIGRRAAMTGNGRKAAIAVGLQPMVGARPVKSALLSNAWGERHSCPCYPSAEERSAPAPRVRSSRATVCASDVSPGTRAALMSSQQSTGSVKLRWTSPLLRARSWAR